MTSRASETDLVQDGGGIFVPRSNLLKTSTPCVLGSALKIRYRAGWRYNHREQASTYVSPNSNSRPRRKADSRGVAETCRRFLSSSLRRT